MNQLELRSEFLCRSFTSIHTILKRIFIPQTTGLTRLVVAKNPHHTLTSLYGKTLRALAKMPQNAAYRIHTEKIITERANIVANVSTKTISRNSLTIISIPLESERS